MFAPYDYKSELSQQRDSAKLFYITINSTACYVLAYITLLSINHFVTAIVAATVFYIKTVIYYNKLDFRVGLDYWNVPRVVGTFIVGPLSCFFMGIVLARFYRYTKKLGGWWKALFLWGYLHAFNLFFGAYVAGVITRTGFRYVSNYMAVPEKAEFAIAFVCVVAMFIFGYFATKQFLQTSSSQSLIHRHARGRFILCMVIIPWMLGSILLALAKAPKITMNELIVYLMIFTIVVPVSIIQRNIQEVNLVKQTKSVGFAWAFIAASGAALVLYRTLFDNGFTVGGWLKEQF